GQDVDVAAPGVGITGAVPLSRNPSGYETADGTSFAAPIVAAAAAWVWTARPSLAASQGAGLLRPSARDIGARGLDTAGGRGTGFAAYVGLPVTGSAASATYVPGVTAAKR